MSGDPRYWVRVFVDHLDDSVMAQALGPWDRLLIAYRAAGRGPAQIPAGVPPKLVKDLDHIGAIVLRGDRYTVPEIDEERAKDAERQRRKRNKDAADPPDVPRDTGGLNPSGDADVPRDSRGTEPSMSRVTTPPMSRGTLTRAPQSPESRVQRISLLDEGVSPSEQYQAGPEVFDPTNPDGYGPSAFEDDEP